MTDWLVLAITIIFQTILTTIVGAWIKSWLKKKEDSNLELQEYREKERKDREQFLIETIENAFNNRIEEIERKFEKHFKENEAEISKHFEAIKDESLLIRRAIQKDAQRDLQQDGEKYLEQGWATLQQKRDFDELYWSYHHLGENGVMNNIHSRVMDLPEKEPEQE